MTVVLTRCAGSSRKQSTGPSRVALQHAVVPAVGDEEVVVGVDPESEGEIQLRKVISRYAGLAEKLAACPSGRELAALNPEICPVQHIQAPAGVEYELSGVVEVRVVGA